jgi:hypothetical protein
MSLIRPVIRFPDAFVGTSDAARVGAVGPLLEALALGLGVVVVELVPEEHPADRPRLATTAIERRITMPGVKVSRADGRGRQRRSKTLHCAPRVAQPTQ